MRISVLGTLECEELTRGPGEQVMPNVPGGARRGAWARSPGLQGRLDCRGEARRDHPCPQHPELRGERGPGRGWRRLRNDIGRSANQARGCARAATSADRRRSRAGLPRQAGGEGDASEPSAGPLPSPGHCLPASLHLLAFSRLLRASRGTLGTKTADPASPAATVARASVAPVGMNSGPLRLDQANLRCGGEETLRQPRSDPRLGGGEEPSFARLKAAAPVL